VVRD